uniref:U-megalopygitoxin(8)-Mo15 n=1 Tax=Megalopyge opercularis TaxID=1113279 RepID=TXU8F_MEGOP|nr:venom protein U-MPTX.8-15 [Megalopyge opercularis]
MARFSSKNLTKLFQYLVLSLLSPVAFGNFNIEVDTRNKVLNDAAINFYGQNIGIITDGERRVFGITDGPLKEACSKVQGGKPGYVWVRSPTPANLYEIHNWRQVLRVLTAYDARIVGIEQKPEMVATQTYKNRSDHPAKVSGMITQSVSNTIENKWIEMNQFSITATVSCKVKAAEIGLSMGYERSWGKEDTNSTTTMLGQQTGFEVELPPGGNCTAVLSATKGSMKIDVGYRATLEGDCAVDFPNTWNGHHYWCYPIGLVQDVGNLKKHIDCRELITIGYYSDAHVTIENLGKKKNKKTKKPPRKTKMN